MHKTYLIHHGIKGQKWGVRRYQNEDGTFTKEGKERYGYLEDGTQTKEGQKQEKHDYKNALKEERLMFGVNYMHAHDNQKFIDKTNKMISKLNDKKITDLNMSEEKKNAIDDQLKLAEINKLGLSALRDIEVKNANQSAERLTKVFGQKNVNGPTTKEDGTVISKNGRFNKFGNPNYYDAHENPSLFSTYSVKYDKKKKQIKNKKTNWDIKVI